MQNRIVLAIIVILTLLYACSNATPPPALRLG